MSPVVILDLPQIHDIAPRDQEKAVEVRGADVHADDAGTVARVGAVGIGGLWRGEQHVGVVFFGCLRRPLAPAGKPVDEQALGLVGAARTAAATGQDGQGGQGRGNCADAQELSPGQNKTEGFVRLHRNKTFRLDGK